MADSKLISSRDNIRKAIDKLYEGTEDEHLLNVLAGIELNLLEKKEEQKE